MSTYDKSQFHAGPRSIASVRGSIRRLMIHEREVIYVVLRGNLQAMLRFQ